jgi:transposase-like protein
MYARGMSVREIRGHLEELYGIDVSADLILAVTDAVLEEVAEWHTAGWLVFCDAIRVKIRAGQALSDYPPLQCRCGSRARASLRNRH